jgi:hypothetical protein
VRPGTSASTEAHPPTWPADRDAHNSRLPLRGASRQLPQPVPAGGVMMVLAARYVTAAIRSQRVGLFRSKNAEQASVNR